MVTIILYAENVHGAIQIRNRILECVIDINSTDTVNITAGGVAVHTEDPVRVVADLRADGFF